LVAVEMDDMVRCRVCDVFNESGGWVCLMLVCCVECACSD
jgi:hypothetical protein